MADTGGHAHDGRPARHRGQGLTRNSAVVSRLPFGGGVGRADRGFGRLVALIGPLLPSERGRGCRPAGDNRRYFEGSVWMARTGAQWRHLLDKYGKLNSVFRRCRRWVATGVFDAMLESSADTVERDTSADMIDSTVVRAHHCAIRLKWRSGRPGARPLARRVHFQAPRPLRR